MSLQRQSLQHFRPMQILAAAAIFSVATDVTTMMVDPRGSDLTEWVVTGCSATQALVAVLVRPVVQAPTFLVAGGHPANSLKVGPVWIQDPRRGIKDAGFAFWGGRLAGIGGPTRLSL